MAESIFERPGQILYQVEMRLSWEAKPSLPLPAAAAVTGRFLLARCSLPGFMVRRRRRGGARSKYSLGARQRARSPTRPSRD